MLMTKVLRKAWMTSKKTKEPDDVMREQIALLYSIEDHVKGMIKGLRKSKKSLRKWAEANAKVSHHLMLGLVEGLVEAENEGVFALGCCYSDLEDYVEPACMGFVQTEAIDALELCLLNEFQTFRTRIAENGKLQAKMEFYQSRINANGRKNNPNEQVMDYLRGKLREATVAYETAHESLLNDISSFLINREAIFNNPGAAFVAAQWELGLFERSQLEAYFELIGDHPALQLVQEASNNIQGALQAESRGEEKAKRKNSVFDRIKTTRMGALHMFGRMNSSNQISHNHAFLGKAMANLEKELRVERTNHAASRKEIKELEESIRKGRVASAPSVFLFEEITTMWYDVEALRMSREQAATDDSINILGIALVNWCENVREDPLNIFAEFQGLACKATEVANELAMFQAARNPSNATQRDECRSRYLQLLRSLARLSIAEDVKKLSLYTEQLKEEFLEPLKRVDLNFEDQDDEDEEVVLKEIVTFKDLCEHAQEALRALYEWKGRHGPNTRYEDTMQARQGMLEATGMVPFASTQNLEEMIPQMELFRDMLLEEKRYLENMDPESDRPYTLLKNAVKELSKYLNQVLPLAGRELMQQHQGFMENLSDMAPGEHPPDTTLVEDLLENLWQLENDKDQCLTNIRIAERGLLKQNDQQKIKDLEAQIESDKMRLSRMENLSVLSRRVANERARVLRHVHKHYPELLESREWMKRIGVESDLLSLAHAGLLLMGARPEDFQQVAVLSSTGGKLVTHVKEKNNHGASRDLVLKQFPLHSAEAARQFYRQCGAVNSLRGANVVTIVGAFVQREFGFVLMPFYKCGDLGAWIKANPDRTLTQCQALAGDILKGLQAIHNAGQVHCDIKPQNIFLTSNGAALVGDFDGVRDVQATVTHNVQVTMEFTPPEVRSGNISRMEPSADMFAFGVLLSKLLADVDGASEPSAALIQTLADNDPLKRPTASQALLDPFFKAMPTPPKMSCSVCWDRVSEKEGLCCNQQHFCCKDCIKADLLANKANRVLGDASVRCLAVDCTGVHSYGALAQVMDTNTQKLVINQVRAFQERELSHEMEKRLQEALAKRPDDLVIRTHRDHIINKILNLMCPRCDAVFFDFNGCCALTCRACPCKFCAWCLVDCGDSSDASHQHVAGCPINPTGSVFGDRSDVFLAMRRLRVSRLNTYWSEVVSRETFQVAQQLEEIINPLLQGLVEPADFRLQAS